jgi:perosamine synthetase
MKYPMFKVHVDSKNAINCLETVLRSGYLNEGEQVKQFKKWLESYLEVDNIVLTNSCTNALTLALKLSNVNPGDEVISTSMTCLASNTPINNLGAKVVWADIDPYTGCIDPEDVLRKISDKTKAVICVNWAGIPCELKRLQKICTRHNIKLIQDAAHAFGAKLDEKSVACYSDFTCFSFQAIKHITTGDGGAIVCKDDSDYKRCNKLKWFGLDREETKDEKGEWKGQRWEVDVEEAGYKFHMNNISAALGLSQIEHADFIVSTHKNNAKIYHDFFKTNKKVSLLNIPSDSEPSFWVYTLLVKDSKSRDTIMQKLNKKGVNAGLVHIPNHNYTCFKDSMSKLENVDFFNDNQISLPCGWWLSDEDINNICLILEQLLEE